MLEITRPHATRRGQGDPQGLDLDGQRRARCTRSWGRTAPARARSRSVLAGRDGYEVTGGAGARSTGKDLLDLDPEERAREGVFLAFQYPVEIPGVSNIYFLQGGAQRHAQAPRRAGARRDGVPRSSCKEKMKLVQMDQTLLQPLGQRGLLGRREEAQRDLPDGGARAAARDPRRDRLRPRHRRAADRRRRRQRAARARSARSSSSRTTSGCSTTSCPTSCTCSPTAASSVGRQGAGARARGEGLRLARAGGGGPRHEPRPPT